MAKLQKLASKNSEVVHEGNQIVLPVINGKRMTYKEGITWLQRKEEEDEQKFNVHHELTGAPLDIAVAFHRALAEIYGWVQGVPTPGFFGPKPPTMLGVQISATETINIPWGRIEVPGLEGYLATYIKDEPVPGLIIGGEVKKKYEKEILKIVEKTKEFLHTASIYKGKAVKIGFEWDRNGDDFDPVNHAPKFLDLSGVKDDDLIFGESVNAALNIGLFTPIEFSAACREYKVPLKRGVLLYGPYGTGKTMTAYVAALKAIRNGWTFVYLDNVMDLKAGLEFAAQYAPCVIFAEDIDRAVHGDRSTDMDSILNILDGVDTKSTEIITVLTTNHIENINPAMLRPGRLDTLVEVRPPDAKAASRLVALYARGLLEESADLTKVGQALDGKIPAFIREVTERAKIAAISRTGGGNIEGKVLEDDLLNAAMAMKNHADMLAPKETNDNVLRPKVFIEAPTNSSAAKEMGKMVANSVLRG